MRTIAIASQKGGVAKTTSAVNLGAGLARVGRRVLLLDLDPQGQCASSLGRDHESGVFNWLIAGYPLADVVRTTGRDGLSLIPGDRRTAVAQIVLNAERRTLQAIRERLPALQRTSLDYLVIDTAPSLGGLQEAALLAADLVIIPTACDFLAAEGALHTFDTLRTLRDHDGWKGRVLGVLPTFYDETTKESRAMLAELRDTFGQKQVLTPIHRATVVRECGASGVSIWERAPSSRTAEEYRALVERVTHVR